MTTITTADRQLTRIRALLAKAEHPNTPPPEAEALSEKAAELMARYAIDRALVDAASPSGAVPAATTLAVPPPYATPKAMLLSSVASAYRVRVVISRNTGDGRACTLIGYPADLAMVELLFTSLLLQAGTAMRQASAGARRVRAFRHAFLIGYADAIGRRIAGRQRLVEHEAATASETTALVLADRRDAVDRRVAELFPRLGTLRASVSDGGGLVAGHQAGLRADLGSSSLGRRARPAIG